jgi:hypothetical protein
MEEQAQKIVELAGVIQAEARRKGHNITSDAAVVAASNIYVVVGTAQIAADLKKK